MRIYAINPEEVREYVLEDDRDTPPEHQVTWELGVIPHSVNNYIISKCTKTLTVTGPDGKPAVNITVDPVLLNSLRVKYGLKGWRNLRMSNGKLVEPLYDLTDIEGYGKAKGLSDHALTVIAPYIPELVRALRPDTTLDASPAMPETTAPDGTVTPAKEEGPLYP
jgi:hypothetical protein